MSCLRKFSCNASGFIQSRSTYNRSLVSDIKNRTAEVKGRARALRVLDIVSLKPGGAPNLQNHLRLVQNFLQPDLTQFRDQAYSDEFGLSRSTNGISSVFDEILLENSSRSVDGDTRRNGWRFDATGLSYAVSSCMSTRDLRRGLGFHCLAIKTGFLSNVYVGSSLISLYCKSSDLQNAYKVFDEMPEKNVVSWTAIISGYAQEWRVDICLELYSKMRNSTSEPNDFTLTTVLSACTGSGALWQGRSAHCQTIQMGFASYVHISNALISMYCKCGSLDDAFQIFDQISNRDVVSWNSMIAGYAQHGLAAQAIELFEEMTRENGTKPDAITYLGVLSSCRHAGLVKEGRNYFNLMSKHGVKPELDHYSCLVDLLGRFGLLQESLQLIENMPVQPNAVIWGSMLSSCRVHGDVWIGIKAAEERLMLEPECAATHVQLANLYAGVGYWEEAATVRKLMKDKGLRTNPGCSWIELKNYVFRFRAEDRTNSRVAETVHVLDCLVDHMRWFGYVPDSPEEEVEDTPLYL